MCPVFPAWLFSLSFHKADDAALVAGNADTNLVAGQSPVLFAIVPSLYVGIPNLVEGLIKLNLT
nr:hypothetical protein [uncultured Sphaerochaeta sp.]